MIETLILTVLAVASAVVCGYIYGKEHAKTLHTTYKGWEITAFEGVTCEQFFIDMKKDEKRFTVTLDPTNNRINWIIKDTIDE